MAPNFLQLQVLTPKIGSAKLTTANTATDGTGALATIFTAGSNGARADRIKVQPLGTNVATVLRIFVNDGGANNYLYEEYTIPAGTISQTQENSALTIDLQTLALPATWKLNAAIGTTVAAGLQVTCEGGDF